MSEFTDKLASAYMADASPSLTTERSQEMAQRVENGDVAVRAAADTWLQTGEMPEEPVVVGHTPKSLNEKYYPCQVFSILNGLIKNPSDIVMLKRFPGRGHEAQPGDRY